MNLYSIMGPTGAGKSSFIEALAGESGQLSISKDQLDGYTQTVNAYHLVNVLSTTPGLPSPGPVYLIDTPGFSDAKISEVEIIDMVRKWLKNNDLQYVNRILFFIPIAETRLPGSRRKTIKMIKQLLAQGNDRGTVTFVTTMWDTLHNERTRKRAESNFVQLGDEVFQDFFGKYRECITQFMNTKNSALQVLDVSRNAAVDSFSKPTSSASPHLYQDLHERIEVALEAKRMIESDLAQSESQTNTELRDILEKNEREYHETLIKFIGQLINFGPLPFGFHRAAQRLRKAIAAQITAENPQHVEIFQQWAEESEILEEPIPESQPSPSPQPLPRASEKLALKGLLRRLLNAAAHRGSKWFKRRA
ncbi:hypothetical protein BJ165DRAFT_1127646 [Panaeolus papilionaceus]|nr:hypothetical protein BJ165DRAFT_1127646 [Panaeolus papilionaceus]